MSTLAKKVEAVKKAEEEALLAKKAEEELEVSDLEEEEESGDDMPEFNDSMKVTIEGVEYYKTDFAGNKDILFTCSGGDGGEEMVGVYDPDSHSLVPFEGEE